MRGSCGGDTDKMCCGSSQTSGCDLLKCIRRESTTIGINHLRGTSVDNAPIFTSIVCTYKHPLIPQRQDTNQLWGFKPHYSFHRHLNCIVRCNFVAALWGTGAYFIGASCVILARMRQAGIVLPLLFLLQAARRHKS